MNKILVLDIETTGLSPWRDEIYMCGLLDLETLEYACCRDKEHFQELLTGRFNLYQLLGHRTDFDIKVLQVQGWLTPEILEGRIIHDSRIMGSLVNRRVPKAFLKQYEDQRKSLNKTLPKGQTHRDGSFLSLKVMAPWYLKVPPFWETPGDHNNEEYNYKDCLYTAGLAKLFIPMLKQEGSWDFYIKLLQWSEMLRKMELKGIGIDLEELKNVEIEYTARRDELTIKLKELWAKPIQVHRQKQVDEIDLRYEAMLGKALERAKDKQKCILRYQGLKQAALNGVEDINYNSPAQMVWLLQDYLGLDIRLDQNKPADHVVEYYDEDSGEMKEDKNISTKKAVLNRLASSGREDIKTFLQFREAEKILSMYIPTYQDINIDGVIHPNFNLTGTRTGRTSCANPNLQQVPAELYRLFKPRDGKKFVIYDLSGIEAALIALYSGDYTLFQMLERGESIHDVNAKALFTLDCPVSEVKKKYPEQRQCAKNLGFACFYGAGAKRIQAVFANAGFVITEQEAKQKLKNLKATYPKVFAFHKEITEIFESGETVFNLLGRPITLQPHDNCYMQGFNTLIQSSASDLNLEACYRFYSDMQEMKNGVSPLLVIHDCILSESSEVTAEHASVYLAECMTDFNLKSEHGPIKLKLEGGVYDRWEK